MTELVLEAWPRSERKKGGARKLRAKGQVPAIIYGVTEPQPVKLDGPAAMRLVHQLHGGERLVTLRMSDEAGKAAGTRRVILKATQTDALGRRLLHVDFHEIDLTKAIHVNIELRPTGTPAGVKLGGVLQTVQREVEVECLATDILEYIDVDISGLEIGDSLHAKDLLIPDTLKLLTDPEETLFVVSAQLREEEEAAEEAAAAPEGAPAEAAAAEEAPAAEGGEDKA